LNVYDTRGRSTARCDAAWRFVGLRRGSCSCAQAPELLVMRASLKTSRDKPGSFLRAIAPNTVTCATPQLQLEKTREVSQQPFLAQKKMCSVSFWSGTPFILFVAVSVFATGRYVRCRVRSRWGRERAVQGFFGPQIRYLFLDSSKTVTGSTKSCCFHCHCVFSAPIVYPAFVASLQFALSS